MKLGIDLHNVTGGGGLSYMTNILRHFDPQKHGFTSICLFGSEKVLARMPDSLHIEKHPQPILAKSLPYRLFFMFFMLGRELKRTGCNVLYSPGGLYFGGFRPYVTISRNMMPFEPQHWSLYPRFSFDRLRLILLRRAHAATFRRADGMIFLTKIAERIVGAAMRTTRGRTAVISHGVNRELFLRAPCQPLPRSIARQEPIRLVYPSRLEPYKHQVEVIEAIADLRKEFPALTIDLCGPANPQYKEAVDATLRVCDPDGSFVHYYGELLPTELPALYHQCHLLIFASSCENLPNTLIEALSFGIPIVCSQSDPMPEVAQHACMYFDPTDRQAIVQAIRSTLCDWPSALERVKAGEDLAARYSWKTCAEQTFLFLYAQLKPANEVLPVNSVNLKVSK
jgi:glycosyltransferase involved in cell wall biosynthesis